MSAGLSPLAMSRISIHLSPRSVTAGVRPFLLATAAFHSFVSQFCSACALWCPSLSVWPLAFYSFVSHFFRWPCGVQQLLFICLPDPGACGRVPALGRLLSCAFFSFVSQACHWCCHPCLHGFYSVRHFSAGHVAFLFICLAGLSLLGSALFRWPCSISIHLSPRLCHCPRCPPFSVGHVAFLFICLPGLSLVVSALFRWPCSISIHLSPRSVTAPPFSCNAAFLFVSQVCHCWCPPFSSAMQHFYSLVSQVCHCWCPPFSAGHVAFLFICFPGLSLVLPPFSAGHVAFLFICLPCDFFLFVFQVWCLHCCFLPCPLEQVHV